MADLRHEPGPPRAARRQSGGNGLAFRGAGDHVESYFVKATAPDAERAIWLKATVTASAGEPERALAEGWAVAFDCRGGAPRHVVAKHGLPYDHASFGVDRLAVEWIAPGGREHLRFAEGASSGRLQAASDRPEPASFAWELSFAGEGPPFELLPPWLYRAPVPSSKTVTPLPDARVRGWVEVAGERWTIDGWRGMQGHNWGRGYLEYGWTHCNAFDEDIVVEAVSSRVPVGPWTTPYLTSARVRWRGHDYAFAPPGSLWRARADVGLRSYHVAAESPEARLSLLVEAKADELVGLRYDGPGAVTCLNSKLAAARVRFEPRGGAPVEATSRAAALEIGTRSQGHGVRVYA